ncbi:thermonuclease family protein [Candidatus Pacearchaeota archaeon]|nr:thermonuclease family protein [Candidatus Pacearchaeota archaeon]
MNVKILGFLLLIITFLLLGYLVSYTGEVIEERKEARVVRVIDGDTIEVNISGTLEKVRLLDVNTPEKGEFYYKEASDFLNSTLNEGMVYIEGNERDRYGRLLGYVFYNGKMINEQIIENGYGHFYSYQDSRYTDELKEAEEYARDNKIGIWQKSSNICSECIILADFDSGKGRDDCEAGTEYAVFYNKCAQGCSLDGWNVKDRATHIYRFKNAVIDKDKKLILYNGIGNDNGTTLYWQNKGCASLWNDAGDALFLRDKEGKLVLYYNY